MNQQKKIIYDCDNTFGIQGCDVDDGLALLYLLGCEEAEILGITAAYGNSNIDAVHNNIRKMLKEIGREEIRAIKGGSCSGDYKSEASIFLADAARENQKQISILATGSLTNLQGAYEYDRDFFNHVKEIVLMGGITEPLVFAKKNMDELNLSCDPKASYNVLQHGKNVSVITGNNCLKVLFTRAEYCWRLCRSKQPVARYIRDETDYWFDDNQNHYGIPGFYNWDVTAAAYLMYPQLFNDHDMQFQLSTEDLQRGYLREQESGTVLKLPSIGSAEAFQQNIYDNWLKVSIPRK